MKRAAGVNVKNKTGYLSMNDNDIELIKDAFYRTMDGLNKLVEMLDKTDMCSEQKIAQNALKSMKESALEHLWMNCK